ncbi:hypothetical protein Taro_016863 [Colocasia esculenta]|uniref:Uncharacterized protein n=1 Tax=Colocasia esculenta TaxID=4460 RepID=A0A843ULZ3_COLES|nr:hypothetical protein [Colocasia esculenta]
MFADLLKSRTKDWLDEKEGIERAFIPGTNIFCKGSVDTTNLGVDTMVHNKGRNVKKSPSEVDTSPEQVDTTPSQVDTKSGSVDTRCLSQKASFAVWDSRSTPPDLRSTLETSSRELFGQSGTVCRHTSRAGRHTPESL